MAAWTNSDIEEAARLWDAGLTVSQIAEQMGRSFSSIQSRLARSGLSSALIAVECIYCGKDFEATNRRRRVCSGCRGSTPTSKKVYVPKAENCGQRKTKLIPCLCCRKPFVSWGAGNRICDECKMTEEFRYA